LVGKLQGGKVGKLLIRGFTEFKVFSAITYIRIQKTDITTNLFGNVSFFSKIQTYVNL